MLLHSVEVTVDGGSVDGVGGIDDAGNLGTEGGG